MNLSIIFLQSGAASGVPNLVMMVAFLAIAYFFFLRPQMKKQKEQTKYMDELKKGDEVCMASGIIGKINKIEGNVIHLQVDTKTVLKVTRGAISKEMTEAVNKGEAEPAK